MSTTVAHPILLVEHDEQRRALMGGWLQDAGYDVLTCPGPSAPEYSCIGSRAGGCPLVDPASLVVLDLSFSPDAMVRAPIGAPLLGFSPANQSSRWDGGTISSQIRSRTNSSLSSGRQIVATSSRRSAR
jgi:CheY-like chemotaxis protein